jgi:hypothetical protein
MKNIPRDTRIQRFLAFAILARSESRAAQVS